MSLFDTMKSVGGERGGVVGGVAVGIVTNNQDPDGLGRVKLRFPWRDSDDESHWARLATTMAGKQMGTYFLPEVGDEVLIAFDQGDVMHPFVLGGLWNGEDKPPESNSDGRNNVRKIRSRSGHEISFHDDSVDRREKVEIRTKAGHRIVLDDSDGDEKIEIVDRSGTNAIRIDSVQNSLTLACGAKLSITADVVEIQSRTSMTIKSGATVNLQGAMVRIN